MGQQPGADPNNIYYVTNGRLTAEMTTKAVQRGDATFQQRETSTQLVAGD
jgi:formate dehydrogenase assembly factor FdhD